MLSRPTTPMTRSPASDRHAEPRLGVGPADLDRARRPPAPRASQMRRGRPVRMTVEVMPGPELDDPAIEPGALVDVVREPDHVRLRVVQRDEQRVDREDRRTRSPTSSMIAAKSSCLASAFADVVDDRQLGVALVRLGQQPLRLVEQPGALEGDGHARGERAQEPLVGLVEGVRFDVLEADDADDAVAGEDRDAEPGVRLRADVDGAQGVRLGRPVPDGAVGASG